MKNLPWLIEQLGGENRAIAALGTTKFALDKWRITGVPKGKLLSIAILVDDTGIDMSLEEIAMLETDVTKHSRPGRPKKQKAA